MKLIDLTGQKFGRLTALYKLHNYHNRRVYWLCVCECGNLIEVSGTNLKTKQVTSCDCLRKEITRSTHKTHDKYKSRLYKIWQDMKCRCNDITHKYYGGRGIAVCDEWKNDFQAFYDWSMANGYNDNLTIDRVDVNGNYEPNNCRWANAKQQARNRSNTKYITYKGDTKTLAEWCDTLNINYFTAYHRIYKYGWSIERALEESNA